MHAGMCPFMISPPPVRNISAETREPCFTCCGDPSQDSRTLQTAFLAPARSAMHAAKVASFSSALHEPSCSSPKPAIICFCVCRRFAKRRRRCYVSGLLQKHLARNSLFR